MELPFRVPPSTSRGPRALSGGYMASARPGQVGSRRGRSTAGRARAGSRGAVARAEHTSAVPHCRGGQRQRPSCDSERPGPSGRGPLARQTSHAAEARGCGPGGSRGSSDSGCHGQPEVSSA
jgi:hypothetical protein